MDIGFPVQAGKRVFGEDTYELIMLLLSWIKVI